MNKNKLIVMSLLGVFMFLLMSAFAQADVVVSGTGVSGTDIVLDVDYSVLDDDDDGEDTMDLSSLSLTFTNDNASQTETVALTLTETSGYTFDLSDSGTDCTDTKHCSFTLNSGATVIESKIITLDAEVQVDEDSGTHADVGKLAVSVNSVSTDYSIDTNVESMLELEQIDVFVEGEEENDLDDNGDDINNVRPGSEVELKFQVENLFDKGYEDGDMEVELTVTLDDNDFGDEIDESEDFDLDSDDKIKASSGEVVVKFDVPNDAEEGEYDLEISLEGQDENGATYTVEWTITLEVDRVKDDVRLETAKLTSETLSCGDSTYLKIKLTNFGSNDQEEVALSVFNNDLGIKYNYLDIELDENPDDDDNSYSKSILIDLDENVKPGNYDLTVRVFIDDDEQVDGELVKLTVTACSTDDEVVVVTVPETTKEDGKTSSTTTGSSLTGSTTAGTSTSYVTLETPLSQVKGIMVFMGIVGLLLLALIVLSVIIVMKK
ncbi:hypothetical protein ACFL0E_00135 [Nanoarchaeota archaeon]